MAGSRRQFGYTDDEGTQWEVQIDETVGEDTSFGFSAVDQATRTARRYLTLSNTKPFEARYVLGSHTDANGDVFKLKRYIGSVSAPLWDRTETTFADEDGRVYGVTALIGEKRYYSPLLDTAVTDGDVDNNITVVP